MFFDASETILSPEQLASSQSRLLKGSGWRIGKHPHREPFSALVGSDTWALELTAAEWQEFCTGLPHLLTGLGNAQAHLMEAEAISLEHRTHLLTLILSGIPPQMTLYLQLQTGRRGEGSWYAEAIPAIVSALQQLSESEALIA